MQKPSATLTRLGDSNLCRNKGFAAKVFEESFEQNVEQNVKQIVEQNVEQNVEQIVALRCSQQS